MPRFDLLQEIILLHSSETWKQCLNKNLKSLERIPKYLVSSLLSLHYLHSCFYDLTHVELTIKIKLGLNFLYLEPLSV